MAAQSQVYSAPQSGKIQLRSLFKYHVLPRINTRILKCEIHDKNNYIYQSPNPVSSIYPHNPRYHAFKQIEFSLLTNHPQLVIIRAILEIHERITRKSSRSR